MDQKFRLPVGLLTEFNVDWISMEERLGSRLCEDWNPMDHGLGLGRRTGVSRGK